MTLFNRGLVWPLLSGFPLDFPNASQAVKWVVSQGMGYHYQTLWHDVRTAFDTFEKVPLQEEFSPFDRIPSNLFIEKDWKNPKSYYYYGEATFKDPLTGELYDRSYSIYADTSLSDRELEELVYAAEEEAEEEYGPDWQVVGFHSLKRFHRWGDPYSEGWGIAEL